MTVRGKAGRRGAGAYHPNAFTPVGAHVTNGTLNAAVTLTPPSDEVNALLIQPTAQPIRYTFDGATIPTATVGFLVAVGVEKLIPITQETQTVRIIETAASASVNYQWGTVATNG